MMCIEDHDDQEHFNHKIAIENARYMCHMSDDVVGIVCRVLAFVSTPVSIFLT